MTSSSFLRALLLALAATLLPAAGPAQAQSHLPMPPVAGVDPGVSGHWHVPEQPGHGVQIGIVDGNAATIAWLTYGADGRPLWLFGRGEVLGDRIEARMYRTDGGMPPGSWPQAAVRQRPWGDLTVGFSGCEDAVMDWRSADPEFATGQLPLRRLTGIHGLRCNADAEFDRQVAFGLQRNGDDVHALLSGFAIGQRPQLDLAAGWARMPEPVSHRHGLRLAGSNWFGGLTLAATVPLRGLEPDTAYRIEFDADFASNALRGCAGAGAPPGEGVRVRLGADPRRPLVVAGERDGRPFAVLNLDLPGASRPGWLREAGDIATTQPCTTGQPGQWQFKTAGIEGAPYIARSDGQGTLWLLVRFDADHLGPVEVWLTGLRARLARRHLP